TRIGPFLTSRLFSWPGKLRMGLDLVIPPRRGDGDESIASFLGRRFGRECVERLGEPLLAGIHSGDPARLSMRLTFPRFLDLERRHGSLIRGLWSTPPPPAGGAPRAAFYSLTGGLTELIDALVASLPRGSLHAGVSVVRVRRDRDGLLVDRDGDTPLVAKAVLLATPPARAARLVAALDEELSRSLESIPAVSTATVLLGFRREDVAHPLEGYGMLVPRSEGLRTTAVTFSSTKFPGRAPAGHVLLRGFLGGARDPDVLELDDDALVSTLRSEMREVLGLRGEPVFVRVFRWPGGTPQLEVGHLGRLARIESRSLSVPGLFLAGAGLRATGIPDVVADATRTAGALAAAVGPLIQGASRDRSLG
ncbi:MAG TPA: protoporphyrinogen oxidase, partial [Vicinamibacteria bacterium]